MAVKEKFWRVRCSSKEKHTCVPTHANMGRRSRVRERNKSESCASKHAPAHASFLASRPRKVRSRTLFPDLPETAHVLSDEIYLCYSGVLLSSPTLMRAPSPQGTLPHHYHDHPTTAAGYSAVGLADGWARRVRRGAFCCVCRLSLHHRLPPLSHRCRHRQAALFDNSRRVPVSELNDRKLKGP